MAATAGVGADPSGGATLVYLYGFVEGGDAGPDLRELKDVTGGAGVRLLTAEGLGALVSDVPASDFDAASLARNLNQLGWLAATARAHEGVLDRVLAEQDVVPVRIGTVYLSDAEVREALEREREALGRAFDRVRGACEWGVKLFVDRQASEADTPPAETTATASTSSPGAAYLTRRREERETEDRRRSELAVSVEQAHEALRRAATDARVLPVRRGELPEEYPGDLAFTAAYLVGRGAEETFREAADDLTRTLGPSGMALTVSGPWPPYNFVDPA